MWISRKSCLQGILFILWITNDINCSNDLSRCTVYYWRVNWKTAVKTCERSNKLLLCYKTKQEIDDITEAFRFTADGEAELEIWMSARNCSKHHHQEECLSLHIQKSPKSTFHFFQTECKDRFPFVCCLREGEVSWTSSTKAISSTVPTECKGFRRRGLVWPDTHFGDVAVLDCPGNSVGKATWACSKKGDGNWDKRGPDLRGCKSQDIRDLKEKLNASSVAETVLRLKSAFDDDEREMFGSDVADVVSILKRLPDRLHEELRNETHTRRWRASRDLAEASTAVVDHIIELPDVWTDIEEKRRPGVGTDLLSSVENFGALLADSMTGNTKEENLIGKNIALQILQPDFGESLHLPQLSLTSHYSRRGNILLDESYDQNLDPNQGNISVVFTFYTNLKAILESQLADDTLNSAVLGASIIQGRRAAPVGSKVRILVEHLTRGPNDTACVFWNLQTNGWDTEGCRLEGSNDTYSSCVCDHLTNFAVLMDYRGVMTDDAVDQLAFSYITVVGCTISIVCLAACVVAFTCYGFYCKHSWGLRYTIHRNLSLTLLIANLVLVLGLDKTENQRACAVVAGVLHYFFLSAFSWMLLEGVHIYRLLVVVFAARRSHWEKYYLFGYGFPMVIVAITVLSRPMYYGTDEVCWLSIEKGTIWAFMGPVACILLFNLVALILAQFKASNIAVKTDQVALVKRWLRITLLLFPVLGITWIFGFLYIGRRFIVAGYLFAIFNSLQGFCIFVCHCVMDKKALNSVLTSLKKKSAFVDTVSSGLAKKQTDSKEADPKVRDSNQSGTCQRDEQATSALSQAQVG